MIDALDLLEHFLKLAEKSLETPIKRRSFSNIIKREVLAKQNYRCMFCGEKLDAKDFDHIDGDSSNNSLNNCQALCPNCHATKTRNMKKRKLKLSQIIRKIKKYLS